MNKQMHRTVVHLPSVAADAAALAFPLVVLADHILPLEQQVHQHRSHHTMDLAAAYWVVHS